MAVLDLQEEYKNRLAKAQKEAADAVEQNEQCLQDLALLDQQIAAAVAERERKLLHEAAAPAAPSDPIAQPLRRHCQNEGEAMELQQVLGMFVDKLMEANCGKLSGVVGKLKEVLSTIEAPAHPQQTAQERTGHMAPPTPPGSEQALPGGPGALPPPTPELNEVSMVEGKRKGGVQGPEDVEEIDEAEEQAAAGLFGDEGATIKKGKKTKTGDNTFSPTLAQAVQHADAITRLVNKNLRGPEASASASSSQQQG